MYNFTKNNYPGLGLGKMIRYSLSVNHIVKGLYCRLRLQLTMTQPHIGDKLEFGTEESSLL